MNILKPKITTLSGSFENWFINYSSSVILDRAVPYIEDGLKPVQRRLLYAMQKCDDGKFVKAANIIGRTMAYHPHGDAGIESALVTLAQKNYLIDKQGNFGNIYTGDEASASRYIEARLSPIAKEILFSNKVTEWIPTYDSRDVEPRYLPVKFPLLLAQGADGIAVSLSCKILPHNFNELCDACIAYYKGEDFVLYPDFQTGGTIAVENYNDGLKDGKIKCRAKIEKIDEKTLVIREIPFGTTTDSIRESIVKAVEKGKIKLKKVEDNTSDHVEILLHLDSKSGISAKKTIDALYLFTDCEVSISTNSIVIKDGKPAFMGVSEILKFNAEKTKEILKKELENKLEDLKMKLHKQTLEKLFIENTVFTKIEQAENSEQAIDIVQNTMKKLANEEVTEDDANHLIDLKFRKLSKFDKEDAEKQLKQIEKEISSTEKDIKNIIQFSIKWFEYLKSKYGKNFIRRTAIEEKFSTLKSATSVVANNSKLYVNKKDGFLGIGDNMRKSGEYICECSDLDDILVVCEDGTYGIVKVDDKAFFKQNIIACWPYKKDVAKKAIYDIVYSVKGGSYVKRCKIDSLTKKGEYKIGSKAAAVKIEYINRVMSESDKDKIKVVFKKAPRTHSSEEIIDFRKLIVKGKTSIGNVIKKNREIENILQYKD